MTIVLGEARLNIVTMKEKTLFWLVFSALLLVVAAVFAPALASPFGGSPFVESASRGAFRKICHQDPERSFILFGEHLAVCARCTGIYTGALLGWAALIFIKDERKNRPVPNWFLIAGFLPLALDGAANLVGIFQTPSWIRCLTGLAMGATSSLSIWPAARDAWTYLMYDMERENTEGTKEAG